MISTEERTMWIITTNLHNNVTAYLGWQKPAWDESGYFWTSEDIIRQIVKNSTCDHPFLFNTRKAGIKHLKSLTIPQKCKVIYLSLEKDSKCDESPFYMPGISIDFFK